MTQMDLFQTATSSQQDTPASPFHLPGSAEAVKMTDISGHTFFPLLKPKDPLGAFSRMFMGMSLWASTRCYLTWKGKATPQGRSLFQLVPQTHLTDETESGLSEEMWPKPTFSTGGASKNPENPRGKHGGNPLATAVAMWPTPRASAGMNDSMQSANKQVNKKGYKHKLEQAVAMWPTPTASLEKHSTKDAYWENRIAKGRQEDIQMAVYKKEGSGSLNPQWVEWLMGYPEGWTDLED